jgi:hypothetical protein
MHVEVSHCCCKDTIELWSQNEWVKALFTLFENNHNNVITNVSFFLNLQIIQSETCQLTNKSLNYESEMRKGAREKGTDALRVVKLWWKESHDMEHNFYSRNCSINGIFSCTIIYKRKLKVWLGKEWEREIVLYFCAQKREPMVRYFLYRGLLCTYPNPEV